MAPAAFVLFWSTGFLGAKLGLPHAPPLTFLLLRFACVTAILALIGLLFRSPWPATWTERRRTASAGLLIHGLYLGGVFVAIGKGVPAGMTALIVGLQPILTALVAGPLLGERIAARHWAGLGLGLAGVALVVHDKLLMTAGDSIDLIGGIAAALVALLGITGGTLYQKRHGGCMNLITGSAVQFAAAGAVFLPLAIVFEDAPVHWTPPFIFALGWLVVVLSIGAISLFYLMIRHGAAARVSSLFFLTPGVTALLAALLFGEVLGGAAILGMVVAAVGVALVSRSPVS